MGLLRAGAESRLLARRLEAVRLQDALEGLRGRAAASAATAAHWRCISVSSGGSFSHFVYWTRETFRMNAGT